MLVFTFAIIVVIILIGLIVALASFLIVYISDSLLLFYIWHILVYDSTLSIWYMNSLRGMATLYGL
jgi:hypothetical protein